MSNKIIDIADALANSLAAYTFNSVAIAPEVLRDHWLAYTVEDMADPVIAVVPAGIETVRTSRDAQQYDYTINVFVGRQAATTAQADAVSDLFEEVQDAIWAHTWDSGVSWPSGTSSPMGVTAELNPNDGLNERNVWRGVLEVNYRLFR